MTKKFVSMFLALAMCLSLTAPAWAANTAETASTNSAFTFIDAEGKENTLISNVSPDGHVTVMHFLEGKALNTVRISPKSNNHIVVNFTDNVTGTNSSFEDTLDNYIVSQEISATVPYAVTAQPYVYQGRATFMPCDNSYAPGMRHTHYLDLYTQDMGTTEEARNLHATEGTAVSLLVGTVLSALTAVFVPAPAAIAEKLVVAALEALGIGVVSGVIQSAITAPYIIQVTDYNVKFTDPDTSISHSYAGERYRVKLKDGSYSSEYQYTGHMPCDSNRVLALIWPDFFSCPYPGLKSVS